MSSNKQPIVIKSSEYGSLRDLPFTTSQQEMVDNTASMGVKQECLDTGRLKRTLSSGRGQEQSVLDQLIDYMAHLGRRIKKLEEQK